MIKKWKIFNESIETFTEEMAQEIIYYFGENSSYDYIGMINHRFDTLYVDKDYNLQDGIFYHETGYDMSDKMREHMSKESNNSRCVFIHGINGDFLGEYHSVNKACRELNIDPRTAFRVLSGKRKQCNGFIFSYRKNIEKITDGRIVKIYKYDHNKNLIAEYDSIEECSKVEKMDRGSLSRVIRKKTNYINGYYYFTNKEFETNLKKTLYCYDGEILIGRFNTIKMASDELKINRTTISKIINGSRKNKLTFFWK